MATYLDVLEKSSKHVSALPGESQAVVARGAAARSAQPSATIFNRVVVSKQQPRCLLSWPAVPSVASLQLLRVIYETVPLHVEGERDPRENGIV
jgi:hypothetical protein